MRSYYKDEKEHQIHSHYNQNPQYYSPVKNAAQKLKFFDLTNTKSCKTFLDIGTRKVICFEQYSQNDNVNYSINIGCADRRLSIWLKSNYNNLLNTGGFDYFEVRVNIARKTTDALGLG